MKRANLLFFVGLFAVLCQDAEGQSEASATKLQILTPTGEVAVGAKVFIGTGETITLVGQGQDVDTLDKAGGEIRRGQRKGKSSKRPIVYVRIEEGEGIDLADIHPANLAGMSGMGMGGGDMEEMMDGMGMGASPARSAFYYVTDPQHGFAFVPKQLQTPDVIRLRPAARLEVAVPKRYSPDQYVVLACWMNRYADPISYQPLKFAGIGGGMGGGDMGMAMGGAGMAMGMGGAGMAMDEGGYGELDDERNGSADPTSVSDPLPSRFSDWRLRTMVTHWTVSEIRPREGEEFANVATVNLPPGEVRITLVPKSLAQKQIGNAGDLERLLFFGGPSQIKLTSESRPDDFQGTILPSGAVRDIEFVGRASASGMPDWTAEENTVLLTSLDLDSLNGTTVSTDRSLIQIAESKRDLRSNSFLGRIAHKVGKDRYVAIGVPNQQYYAWSVNSGQLPRLSAAAKTRAYGNLLQSLQPLSVRAISPAELEIRNKDHDPNDLQLAPISPMHRLAYQFTRPQSNPAGRMLIDLTKPIKFQASNPGDDPFAAPNPNEQVGVISETEIKREMARSGFGEKRTMEMSNLEPAEAEQRSAFPIPGVTPSMDAAKLNALQRRIEKLQRDLDRAKQLLKTLQPT